MSGSEARAWATGLQRSGWIPAQRRDQLLLTRLGGRYRLERVIREGSRSVIYEASDHRLRRRVVAKVAWAGCAAMAERVEAEARIHAALHHPAIPELLDLVSEGPLQALIMEHVDGVDLDELLQHLRRPIGLPRLQVLMAPVIAALGYLHSQGVVHRDVKPANIIVYEHLLRERTKLIDFGVARQRRGLPAATPPELTTGTLLYMSPEHFCSPERVDERSDIYSLGVTMFEMVTGSLPFYARTPTSLARALTLAPPPSPRDFNPEVGPGLESVILRALEKDPARRFSSAAELQAALLGLREPGAGPWRRWRRRGAAHCLARHRPGMITDGEVSSGTH